MPKDLLVRKYTESARFKPHMNTTMGRYYHTKEDYLKDLKAKGLEPFQPGAAKEPAKRPYTPSRWARDMVNSIKNTRHLERGSRIDTELRKRGQDLFRQPGRTDLDPRKGGFI